MSNERITQQELIGKAFKYWNNLKRHRALADIKALEGEREQSNYHRLRMYQNGDQLELALRAIQTGQREIDEEGDEE